MKFAIVTLGCKVNTYESSAMSELLKSRGYEEVKWGDFADIYIINTCTVTNTADSKSLKTIKKAIKLNKDALVIAAGCMIQNDSAKASDIEGLDIIIGNKNKTGIIKYIDEYFENNNRITDIRDVDNETFEDMTISDVNRTRAFVKIQDGCNNYCAYCIIPYVRGNVSSKDPQKVLSEVTNLVLSGHSEIVLTGIHTGNYGTDLKDHTLADLLNSLVKINGLKRLRISSIEINEITDEVIDIIKNNNVLVDHMHIPVQSGNNKVLKEMNRKYTKEEFIDRINKIREIRPNINITTDVIFGFPGETNEEFLDTIETLKKIKFSKLHVFPYSKRDGTKAALRLDEVDNKEKRERCKIALALSDELELEYMQKFIGTEITFIPETYKDGILTGHTGNFLLIKTHGPEDLLHKDVLVKLEKIKFPYIIASIK